MALELIGRKFGATVLDLHHRRGRSDLPHHEDEIAQSCRSPGSRVCARLDARQFLSVRGTKMSKRFGNYTTARDLQQDGVDAGAIRLLIFQTHYRQKLDLTDAALAEFAAALNVDLNAPAPGQRGRRVRVRFRSLVARRRGRPEPFPGGLEATDAVETTRPRVSRSDGWMLAPGPPNRCRIRVRRVLRQQGGRGRGLDGARSRHAGISPRLIYSCCCSRGVGVRDRKDGTIGIFRRA
jgi:hypothetical protein